MFFSKYFSAALAFASIIFFSGALVAIAANTMDIPYTALAPLPLGEGGTELKTYTISTYLSGMFKLIIALGAAFAVLMGITGGIQYVASGIAPAARKGAKERITNALLGLVIILTSYLILNTIDPKLVAFNFGLPPIEGTRAVALTPLEFLGFGTTSERWCVPPQTGTTWPSDAYEREVLNKKNILVNKANCTTVGESGCTSVCGLKPDVIDALGELKKNCDNKMGKMCAIWVTGATEHWLHKSHNNNRNVDLGMSQTFDAYVRKSIYLGTGHSCGIYSAPHWSVDSHIFVDEGDHWHTCF
jgi:hypothetical protein